MKKTEFEEMVAINLALSGKYDVVVAEIAEVLEFGIIIPRKGFDNAILDWISGTLKDIQLVLQDSKKDTVVKSKLIKVELGSRKNEATHEFEKKIFGDLAKCTPEGDLGTITVSLVANAWLSELTKLQTFFKNTALLRKKDTDFIPNKDFKKIRTEAEIHLILNGAGNSKILSLYITNNIDKTHLSYIETTADYTKKEDTFTDDIKLWASGIKAEMNDIINDNQDNYLVFQSLLSEKHSLITEGDKLLDPVKIRICNAIVNAIDGETTAATIAKTGLKEVNNIIADAPLLRELFLKYYEPIQGKDKNIVINGPVGFGQWIHKSIKENLIQKFIDAVVIDWKVNNKGVNAIAVFISDLAGKNYPLSKTRLAKNLKAVLTRNKNGVNLDSLLYDELLKSLTAASSEEEDEKNDIEAGTNTDRIAPQALEQLWIAAVNKIYTEDSMKLYYKSGVHPLISDYGLLDNYIKTISFEALPADHLIKEVCYRSHFVPKPKKKEPKPLPSPTPTPTPRHNQLVTFKKLPYNQLELLLLKDGKELDSIDFYEGAPNSYEIGQDLPVGDYEIIVRYSSKFKDEVKTAEQKEVFKEAVRKKNKTEGFLCIFNFSNKENSNNLFEFNLEFIPKTVEIYSRLGNKLIEIVEINSISEKGFFAFFTAEDVYSPFHNIFEFFIRFKGTHPNDFHVTEPLIKSTIGSCAVKYTVVSIYEPVIIVFPHDPKTAWLTYDNNPQGTELTEPTSSTPILKETFDLGKGIEGGSFYYLHVSGNGNGGVPIVVSKRVYKQYSNDYWAVTLSSDGANLANNVDYNILRAELLRAMGDWTDDFTKELISILFSKLDKDAIDAQSAANQDLIWSTIDVLVAGLSLFEVTGAAASIIDFTAKVVKISIDLYSTVPNWFKEEEASLESMLNTIEKGIIQKTRERVRTTTIREQDNYLSLYVKENHTKNTTTLTDNIYTDFMATMPKAEKLLKGIKDKVSK
jgi:hypothetical protein